MIKHIYTPIFSVLLLTACSSNGPLFHSFGDYDENGQGKGIYLLEEPYQIKDVWYFPAEQYDYSEQGLASWYIPSDDSLLTANGEVYDTNMFSARHKTLPLPTIVKITNMENNKSIVARVNDRGPMVNNRLIDVSQAAKEALEMPTSGTVMVKVEVLPEESKLAKSQLIEQNSVKSEEQKASKQEEDNLTLISPDEPREVVPPAGEILYQPEDHYVASTKTNIAPVVGDTRIALGSFANPQNAQNLKTKLSVQYPVSIETVERGGKTLNVVKVGPYSKTEAKKILNQLKQEGYKDAYMGQ